MEQALGNTLFSGTYESAGVPLWARALEGAIPGPDIQVSTLAVNSEGNIRLQATGATSNDLQSAVLGFARSAEFEYLYSPFSLQRMVTNYGAGLPLGQGVPTENISITNAYNTQYESLALANLYVYGPRAFITASTYPLASLTQYQNTTLLNIQGDGTYIANLLTSTINGRPANQTINPTDILASSITINSNGYIQTPSLIGVSTINGLTYPQPSSIPDGNLQLSTLIVNPVGFIISPTLFASNATVANNMTVSTINGVPYPSMFSTIVIISTGFYEINPNLQLSTLTTNPIGGVITTPSLYVSSLYVSSIVDYIINVSSVTTQTVAANSVLTSSLFTSLVSSTTATLSKAIVSTLTFPSVTVNPTSGLLQGTSIDLGMGAFLGSALGQLGGVAMNAAVGGVVLGTGAAILVNSRMSNSIIIPGQTNTSTFNLINTQTQLQFSTLGSATSTFSRFVSSINPSIIPGNEYFISSIIPAGTLCLRSYSDPLNPPAASSITSTIQSFGAWQIVPSTGGGGGGSSTITSTFNEVVTFNSTIYGTYAFFSNGMTVNNVVTTGTVALQGPGTSLTVANNASILGGNLTLNNGGIIAINGNVNAKSGNIGGTTMSNGSFTTTTLNVAVGATIVGGLNTSTLLANNITTDNATIYYNLTTSSLTTNYISLLNANVQNLTASSITTNALSIQNISTNSIICNSNVKSSTIVTEYLQVRGGGIDTNFITTADIYGFSDLTLHGNVNATYITVPQISGGPLGTVTIINTLNTTNLAVSDYANFYGPTSFSGPIGYINSVDPILISPFNSGGSYGGIFPNIDRPCKLSVLITIAKSNTNTYSAAIGGIVDIYVWWSATSIGNLYAFIVNYPDAISKFQISCTNNNSSAVLAFSINNTSPTNFSSAYCCITQSPFLTVGI